MTTIYLAKKLMSLKTNKIQLENILLLKKRNMRETAETKRSLQKINKHRVFNRCRLCLGPAETNIFNDEVGIHYAEDIKTILDIEVSSHDGKPQYMCVECASTLRKAVELKQVAVVSQWRLEQETVMVCESTCDDNVDECFSHDDEDTNNCHGSAPNCKEHQKGTNKNKVHNEDRKKSRHINLGRRLYICETCGMKLKTMSRLKTHMLVHTNEFNYSCSHCPYRSRNRSSLQIHERTHTGVRPYKCAQCHSTFSSASNLASHRRSHLPPVFKCDVCDKGFKFKQPLLDHIATQHRSAKPFFCCECGSSFAIKKLLLRHERKIHKRPNMPTGATACYIKSQKNLDDETQEQC